MKYRFISAITVVCLFDGLPAHAQGGPCQPIIDANKAQWQAPMVHDRKVLDSGFTMETIKLGDVLYMKSSGDWRIMPPAMTHALTDVAAIEKAGLEVKDCKQIGAETIDGVPTRIYSFTTTIPNSPQNSASGKVWIGKDGRPYRMEGPNAKGTIAYKGVTAPKLGK